LTDDINNIIQKAYKDNSNLINNVDVFISNADIYEIIKRFDKYNPRLTAFAILCYAKMYADKKGIFYLSRVGLSNWLKIAETHLSSRYLKELINFDYVKKVSNNKNYHIIGGMDKFVSKIIPYKINVNFVNKGNFVVKDNNIRREFEDIIKKYSGNCK